MRSLNDMVHLYRREYAIRKAYMKQVIKNGNKKVRFYNWNWGDEPQLWFSEFIRNTGLEKEIKRKINFCTVFGRREILAHVNNGVKVFFSGENLHLPDHKIYSDGLLEDKDCKLSLGFDKIEDERYLRFPLWLTYVFEPTLDKNIIHERCEQLRYPQIGNRSKFASLIARADISGIRTSMYNGLSEIEHVDCPSDLFHNDDSLHASYGDNKVEYLRNYIFNICPENSNANGYCTEKIFEAIYAGCIPAYWGDDNSPESKILNHDAIIFWDKGEEGKNAIIHIKKLMADRKLLEDYLLQPRLHPEAEDVIRSMMEELYQKLRILAAN